MTVNRIPGPVMQHIFSYVQEPTTTEQVSKQWRDNTFAELHSYLQKDPFFSDYCKRIQPLNLSGKARTQACVELVLRALNRLKKELYPAETHPSLFCDKAPDSSGRVYRNPKFDRQLSLPCTLKDVLKLQKEFVEVEKEIWVNTKKFIDYLSYWKNPALKNYLGSLPKLNENPSSEERMQWTESVFAWLYAPENKDILENLYIPTGNDFPLWALYFPNRRVAFNAFVYWLRNGDFANVRSFIEGGFLDQFNDDEVASLQTFSTFSVDPKKRVVRDNLPIRWNSATKFELGISTFLLVFLILVVMKKTLNYRTYYDDYCDAFSLKGGLCAD